MKIGTIGTNFITDYILENIEKTEGLSCGAVYSRKEETGRKLADKYHISKVYTDLDKMLQDDTIDCIYIASPNSLHFEQAKKALEHGKHVICEKPFTPIVSEAEILIRLAKEKHLFLFEGITTLYQPGYQWAKENLHLLGDLKLASCTFCQYSSLYDALMAGQTPNIFNPAFAGGSLMDINFYNIHFLVGLFGKPDRIEYFAGTHENGIDTHGILILQLGSLICQCTGAKDSKCENSVQIMGDKGYLHLTPGSSNCQHGKIVLRETEISVHQNESPWYYEMQGIAALVQKNDYDTCYQMLENTRTVVQILEKARKSAGLRF